MSSIPLDLQPLLADLLRRCVLPVSRILLRLLDMQSIARSDWDRITATVPVHCSGLIADIARRCADSWNIFANQVEQRARCAEQDLTQARAASQ